jgi:hypothetical protein
MLGLRIDRFQRLQRFGLFRAFGAIPAGPAFRALAALAIAGAIGCSGGPDPHGPCDIAGGPSTASAAFGGIDYQVVGGFSGHGDGTTLHVAANGAFSRHTAQHGDEQGSLDSAALADLVARARAAEFPTLCPMYASSGVADDLVYQVSVQFDGRQITSRASQFGDPPDRLQAVIGALQQIVQRPL